MHGQEHAFAQNASSCTPWPYTGDTRAKTVKVNVKAKNFIFFSGILNSAGRKMNTDNFNEEMNNGNALVISFVRHSQTKNNTYSLPVQCGLKYRQYYFIHVQTKDRTAKRPVV